MERPPNPTPRDDSLSPEPPANICLQKQLKKQQLQHHQQAQYAVTSSQQVHAELHSTPTLLPCTPDTPSKDKDSALPRSSAPNRPMCRWAHKHEKKHDTSTLLHGRFFSLQILLVATDTGQKQNVSDF